MKIDIAAKKKHDLFLPGKCLQRALATVAMMYLPILLGGCASIIKEPEPSYYHPQRPEAPRGIVFLNFAWDTDHKSAK